MATLFQVRSPTCPWSDGSPRAVVVRPLGLHMYCAWWRNGVMRLDGTLNPDLARRPDRGRLAPNGELTDFETTKVLRSVRETTPPVTEGTCRRGGMGTADRGRFATMAFRSRKAAFICVVHATRFCHQFPLGLRGLHGDVMSTLFWGHASDWIAFKNRAGPPFSS